MDVARDPHQCVEVAQGPLAVLDVGLDQIAAIPEFLVPRVALGELCSDERGLAPLDHFHPEARHCLLEQPGIAADEARLEHGGARGHVAAGQRDQLGDGADRLPDFQLQVPQGVERSLDHLLAPGGAGLRRQEHEVDIAVRRHFAPPVTAQRDQPDPFRGRGIGIGIGAAGRFECGQDQFVGECRGRRGMVAATRRRGADPPLELGTLPLEKLAQLIGRGSGHYATLAARGLHGERPLLACALG